MTGPGEPNDLRESDPNGAGPEGLAGGMGVSSERVGKVRGSDVPQTHGTEATGVAASDSETDLDPPPEQTAN